MIATNCSTTTMVDSFLFRWNRNATCGSEWLVNGPVRILLLVENFTLKFNRSERETNGKNNNNKQNKERKKLKRLLVNTLIQNMKMNNMYWNLRFGSRSGSIFWVNTPKVEIKNYTCTYLVLKIFERGVPRKRDSIYKIVFLLWSPWWFIIEKRITEFAYRYRVCLSGWENSQSVQSYHRRSQAETGKT